MSLQASTHRLQPGNDVPVNVARSSRLKEAGTAACTTHTPPRSSAATCSAERWERPSEHVVDGLPTLAAITSTIPTGRVAMAPLVRPYSHGGRRTRAVLGRQPCAEAATQGGAPRSKAAGRCAGCVAVGRDAWGRAGGLLGRGAPRASSGARAYLSRGSTGALVTCGGPTFFGC